MSSKLILTERTLLAREVRVHRATQQPPLVLIAVRSAPRDESLKGNWWNVSGIDQQVSDVLAPPGVL